MEAKIKKSFEESIRIKEEFVEKYAGQIADVAKLIADAFNDGRKLILFGNGGSACDASHIAAVVFPHPRAMETGACFPSMAWNG